MKKALCILGALAGMLSQVSAQNSSAVLDANQVRSVIYPKNSLFWDGMSLPSYEVPAGSGNHSMYLGNLWLMGKDINNLLHGYYNRYEFAETDTLPGPLTEGLATTTAAIADRYKRVWKINQWEIDLLTQAQANGQLTSGAYVPSADILEWPANAPTPDYADNLAPFFDFNADGAYNIYDGDYPIIKGGQMLYFILNDRGTQYQSGVDIPLQTGLEIHVSIYGCKKDEAIDSTDLVNYTTFLEYDIYNRGNITLSDVYAGFNTDADIGYAMDDYTGSHVDANAFYFYNGDAIDAQGPNTAPGQYGINSPVQSIQFLEAEEIAPGQSMAYFMNYANSAGATGDPSTPQEYYNLLHGYWRNGSGLVYGGGGYPGASGATNIASRYMYPGSSDPLFLGTGSTDPGFLWSQESPCPTCLQNVPTDQRGVGSTGPFSLMPGANFKLVLGLITTFDSTLTISDRVEKNREQNKLLKQWYDADELPCVLSEAPLKNPNLAAPVALNVYPNPAANVVSISGSVIHAGMVYELVDIHGRTLRSGVGQQEGLLNLDIENLAGGIYFVRINGQVVKFLKK